VKRVQLEHIVRAASSIADDANVVIIGSQSILGSFSEADLPEAAFASVEADIAFWDDEHFKKADSVDGASGEDSPFHATHGYYAQGVEVSTAVLPVGWRDRIVVYASPNAEPGVGHCLEPHDLVVSKLVAGREKDFEFAGALLHAGLISSTTLMERASALDVPLVRSRVVAWVVGWIRRYG